MTAARWAQELSDEEPLRWRALEVAAFSGHPQVLRALDPQRKYGRTRSNGVEAIKGIGLFFVALVLWVVVLFPSAVGAVLLLGSSFTLQSGNEELGVRDMLPWAGVSYGFSAVVIGTTLVYWAVTGRKSSRMFDTQSVFAVLFGLWGLVVVLPETNIWNDLTLATSVVAIILSTVMGGLFEIILFLTRASKKRSGEDPVRQGRVQDAHEPLKSVRVAVEKLSSSQQETIRRDITKATEILTSRDRITGAQAEWAQKADLGKLALHMSQPIR